MKNKSVQNCGFVHHAKFNSIMTKFNSFFNIEFEGGELEQSQNFVVDFAGGGGGGGFGWRKKSQKCLLVL